MTILVASSGTYCFAASPADDKPRIAEFQTNKVPVVLFRPKMRHVDMDIEKLELKDGVVNFKLTFADGTPGEVYVPITQKGVKVTYKNTPELRRMREYYTKGLWDEAVKAGRSYIYPSVAVMSVPETVTNIQDNLVTFVDSLLNAERYIEAKSLMESLPLAKATPTVGSVALSYANRMVDLGRFEDAEAIVERLNFGGENIVNIEKTMDFVHKLRKMGKIQEALKWYTKLQSTPNNPDANEATLWMAYCDVIRGNVISAQLFVDQLSDLQKSDAIFSLKCLINGMLLVKAQKEDSAIDVYAEGIVYGDITQTWMPELLFNTATLYKKFEKFRSSNEIFEQIMLLYPNENFAELSKSQIVEIKEEPAEGEEEGEAEEE